MLIPVIHVLLGLSSHHLQAYTSGLWMLLLLAKPMSQEHISLSGNLWWKSSESFSIFLLADNQIYHTFTGLPDYNIQAVTHQLLLHPPRDATNLSQLHYERWWVISNSLIPLPQPLLALIKEGSHCHKVLKPYWLGPLASLSLKQPKLIKRKVGSQKDAN